MSHDTYPRKPVRRKFRGVATCYPAAGHLIGDGVTAQANCVEGPRVCESMVEAFVEATGSLAQRLLTALDADELLAEE